MNYHVPIIILTLTAQIVINLSSFDKLSTSAMLVLFTAMFDHPPFWWSFMDISASLNYLYSKKIFTHWQITSLSAGNCFFFAYVSMGINSVNSFARSKFANSFTFNIILFSRVCVSKFTKLYLFWQTFNLKEITKWLHCKMKLIMLTLSWQHYFYSWN